ncbi:MAG: hypothetical protein QOD54_250 [Sphingomonadales bacterium]|jgi:ElaB/YqjD/DUF883 family membrane-anchored ribosome-binding protein|nr:hypothetical protein [Sphingomonadales bacterium]
MIDQRTDDTTAELPDGTDTVIEGASKTEDTLVATTDSTRSLDDSDRGLVNRIREGREQLSSQAGERARGFVTQGLERTSEALANVSKMIGDTAAGIDERLGSEYGDYARRAAGALEDTANGLAAKDPDELIEDTRNFVRNSPGIALAGAAVVGFVVARLLKTGLAPDDRGEDDD